MLNMHSEFHGVSVTISPTHYMFSIDKKSIFLAFSLAKKRFTLKIAKTIKSHIFSEKTLLLKITDRNDITKVSPIMLIPQN